MMAGSCWFEVARIATTSLGARTGQASRAVANASVFRRQEAAEVRDHEADEFVCGTWSLAFPVELPR